MSEDELNFITEWFEKADHDIRTAQLVISYDATILDSACFHCQQAVEKYLKGFLIYNRVRPDKTHNVNKLRIQCAVFERDFQNFDFKNLNLFAVDLRYPGDSLQPTLAETKEYLQMAENVKKLVLKKVVFD